MRPLYISEGDVLRLLPMSRAINLLREAAIRQAEGDDVNSPRRRLSNETNMLHILPASSQQLDRLGMKAYVTGKHGAQFWYFLFSENLCAILEADMLGRIRTGAASAVATAQLARPDAKILGVVGSGNQAYTQIEAISCVRALEEIRIFSRKRERMEMLAEMVRVRLGKDVVLCDSVEQTVHDAHIVCTVTSAREPILFGSMLAPGTHINAVGSNRSSNREIDNAVIERAQTILVEDIEQAQTEAGDFLRSADFSWKRVTRLCDYVREGCTPPATSDLTLFESLGIGLWDLAVATDVAAQFTAERSATQSTPGHTNDEVIPENDISIDNGTAGDC